MAMELPVFPVEAVLTQSDADLGKLLLGWFIGAQAECHGVRPAHLAETVVRVLPTMEAHASENVAVEKALHKAATGHFATAGRILRDYIVREAFAQAAVDEAATGSHRQRAAAQRPRHDTLQTLILEILAAHPQFRTADVLRELTAREGHGVVDEITEDEIFFIDRRGKGGNPAPRSGLKDRVSRAKKTLDRRHAPQT